MWLGLGFVTVLGVGLPVLAWWLSRRMEMSKPPYSKRRKDAYGAPGLVRPKLLRRRLEQAVRLNV
jgi:hypothetical protein